jgi:hypothetical protein
VTVQVHEYPDGTLAVFHGPRRLAGYRSDGTLYGASNALSRGASAGSSPSKAGHPSGFGTTGIRL